MPNLADKAPGVYVIEKQGAPPIAGVGTSTAAIIGVSNVPEDAMPINPAVSGGVRFDLADPNDPQLLTNFQQFKNEFGVFHPNNRILAHAVFGFFANGGTRCHVVRIEGDNPTDFGDIQAALDEIEKIDEVALVLAPGARKQAAQKAIIDHCAKDDLQDRFAILDAQDEYDQVTPEDVKGDTEYSDYAALYFPDIKVSDQTPLNRDGEFAIDGRPNSEAEPFPPSGHIAGMYGRVDFNRGVHKAPANEGLAAALGLAHDTTEGEHGPLNQSGINVIRKFRSGIKVWGARTLGGDDNGEFKYINVRRLFLFLRESIDEGTQFVVFEPNTEALWAQITRTVTAFLTTQWRAGALFGSTPDEAFFVQCDHETNPPEMRRNGYVTTRIGVAPAFPAEFVVFEISQKTLGAE